MKLLLAVGSPDLFQICRCFRKEEEGRLHQNEFAMLEWYHRGWSYRELMEECEELLQHVAVSGGPFPAVSGRALLRQEKTISLASPWDRFTVDEVFREYAGVGAREAVRKNMFDELLITRVEPRLGWERPAFLHDYPVELGSLARGKKEDDTVAERFELYIAGIELVNGFSELVDPVEQRRRFAEEIARIGQAGRIADMPEKFLADLAVMGQSAGAALGLDRVFMLLLGADAIAEAVTLNEEDV
jgi:lysyl-tRNA synthetase class 2